MVFHKARNCVLSIAATVLVLGSAGAYADDTEIFLGNPSNLAAPNIMLILDTSGSMGSNTISPVPYDRNFTYARHGQLLGHRQPRLLVHQQQRAGLRLGNWFDISFLKCAAALTGDRARYWRHRRVPGSIRSLARQQHQPLVADTQQQQ